MKPVAYIRKYKLDKTKHFDHNAFVGDLTCDFLTLLEVGKGMENIKGFENAIRAIRMKWDGIDNKTRALPEKLWKYFYATVVAKMREELFPEEMKQRKEKKERWKKYKEQERQWHQQEQQRFFEEYLDFYDAYKNLFADLFQNIPCPVDEFALLGLTDEATAEEVKQAYRKLAFQHHPDRGGNQAVFVKITEAKNKCLAFLSH